MSDSDDDLLELAGISSAEESDHEPQNVVKRRAGARKRGLDDDEEDGEDDEDMDDDMGLDGDDDDDIEELNPEEDPYPLEGKYKNEEDKNQLMQMDEIKREGILYDRIQEKEKFRERRFLALRAKQSKVESKSIRKSTSSSAKKLKTSKLSELKRQRERKNNKGSRNYNDDDDDDENDRYQDEEEDDDDDLRQLAGYNDDDDDDDEAYYSDDRYAAAASKRYASERSSRAGRPGRSRNEYDPSLYKEAPLDEINNKIRSTRTVLEKFLYRDEFDTCIPGTVVRVNIGFSKTNNEPLYKMALVEEVKRGGKTYQLLGKICNTYLKVSQGESSTIIEISYLSNSPITPPEFEAYKKKVNDSTDHELPTLKYVQDKFEELRNMATKQLTDADINRMMERKQEISLDNMNMADRVKKLGKLREDLEVAVHLGNKSEIKSLQEEIQKLSQYFQSSKGRTSKLEQINIRNQKSNQEFIRKAEKKLVESRRKQLQNNDFSDPFSRLRTNLRVFYRSNDKNENNVKEEEKKVDVQEEKNNVKNSIFRRQGIDALIKDIEIDLDIDLEV